MVCWPCLRTKGAHRGVSQCTEPKMFRAFHLDRRVVAIGLKLDWQARLMAVEIAGCVR